jgi:hypothetical protein
MRAACLYMTNDQKVFAVMDSAATIGVSHSCYAEHKTPHVFASGVTVDEKLFASGGGYNVSTGASQDRALFNWATVQLELGAIGAGKPKLGILSDDCAPSPDVFDRLFKPFLKRQGVAYEDARIACDAGQAQQQIPSAVLKLRQANVGSVFLASGFQNAQLFLQVADGQRWRPKFTVSDLWGLTLNFAAANFPPDAFDRSRGVTFTHSGEKDVGKALSPPVQRCSKILAAAGLPGVTDEMGTDSEVVSLCDSFNLWLTAMRRTAVNPLRTDWIASVESLGEYASAYPARSFYRRGKLNGGDSYAVVEWQRECRCWKQVRSHVPGRY